MCIGAYKWLLRLHLIWFISRLVFYTQNNKRCWKSCELCKLKKKSFSLSLYNSACVCVCVWRVVHCIIPFRAKLKTSNKNNNSNNNCKCSKAIRFLYILQLNFASASSVITHFIASLCACVSVCARGKIYGKRTNELKKAILLLKFPKLHKFLVSFSLV